uniref:Uncharacterized protein n=1 Tax=Mycolicibacterium sp. CBMA 213 TaxID=1968788 RepID=A0A343VRK3_9MYCO|nr:hypothetical protein B5P44_p00232 [Mycolicibacterium sp. CBMA 213]
MRELRPQHTRSSALESTHHRRWRVSRPNPHEQVHMIGHHLMSHDFPAMLGGDRHDEFIQPEGYPSTQHPAAVLRTPHQMQAQRAHASRRATKSLT